MYNKKQMDYNLKRQVQTEPEYEVYKGMRYGQMSDGLLVAKFEETNMPDHDEHVYDNFARNTLSDFRPDSATFAHEAPRGATNRSKGFLQLRSEGHRGTADVERPELFLGFGGPEDMDPRGIATEPDFKQLKKQHEARMRFQRFDPDGSDHITGGGRNEFQVMQDKQKLIRWTRDRLKVFDRQIDGRREGMRREFRKRPVVKKQVLVQSYGDFIKDYALNPQRRANIISKQIIRDTRAYRDETPDQDFQFMRYTQTCKQGVLNDTFKRALHYQNSADSSVGDSDVSTQYKALAVLMSNMANRRREIMKSVANGDIDHGQSADAVSRKTAPIARDIAIILASRRADMDYSDADDSVARKSVQPMATHQMIKFVDHNHEVQNAHLVNAAVIYKSVKEGADMTKIKHLIKTDARAGDLRDEELAARKNGIQTLRELKMTQKVKHDTDAGKSVKTMSYRGIGQKIDQKVRNGRRDQKATESDATQTRHTPQQTADMINQNNLLTDSRFLDNGVKERLGGHLGSKYNMRDVQRDNRAGGMSFAN